MSRKRRPRTSASDGGAGDAVPGTTTPSAVSPGVGGVAGGSGALLDSLSHAEARGSRGTSYTAAGVVGVLYDELVMWAIREVAIRYRHRQAVTRARAKLCSPFKPPLANGASAEAAACTPVDLRGDGAHDLDLHFSDKNVTATCTNCGSTVSASRYAQHLEKCMGRGGRVSSRAASARLKASAAREEREDSEDAAASTAGYTQRRRRAVDENGPKPQKRRRPSPAPVAAATPPAASRSR